MSKIVGNTLVELGNRTYPPYRSHGLSLPLCCSYNCVSDSRQSGASNSLRGCWRELGGDCSPFGFIAVSIIRYTVGVGQPGSSCSLLHWFWALARKRCAGSCWRAWPWLFFLLLFVFISAGLSPSRSERGPGNVKRRKLLAKGQLYRLVAILSVTTATSYRAERVVPVDADGTAHAFFVPNYLRLVLIPIKLHPCF